ncbi:NAD(+) diphosphatase [Gordonia jinhuaensis]|uniref:NAD(+) diphosphatase n=2 Tax=Gordonia jinhuaensis TaxID=1517702 RepID=A0A916TIN4_9ACTN|nr:putative NADH pyrophosphatase/NUDIX hydrolase [Gordonia jinhuaensis]
MSEFSLTIPPMLSRSTVDRADEIRDDPARMRGGWPGALVLVIDGRGRYPVADNGLRWIPAGDIGIEPPEEAVFLGIRDGADLWALRGDHVEAPASDPRRGAHLLDGDDAGLLATATAMLNWHDSAHFSPVDGKPTRPARGGWVRRNIDSGIDEFPRTDAAIITVVHDGADRILLGRQAVWPERWYSTLAGFVEPGESLEQAVAREVHEEVGLDVHDQRYLGSQPWPFPRSLMVGFAALADPEKPLEFIDGEIADAAWFTRDEVRRALAQGDEWVRGDPAPEGDDLPRLLLPGSISIARAMIEAWAQQPA